MRRVTDADRAAETERRRKARPAGAPDGWERFAPVYPNAELVGQITVVRPMTREYNPLAFFRKTR